MNTPGAPREPRTIVLFGIPFHDITMEETLVWIDQMIASRRAAYLVTANLDFAAQASEDVELQRILVEAELVLCDGTPLVWASRFTGKPLRERVAGSDLVPKLAARAEKMRHRIFLLGGDPESLARAAENLQKNHPLLPTVHYYSPPFAPLHEFDNQAIVERVQQARPDILLVAFGCPKQEKWIYMHYRKLGVPCCIGVGATIDFLAGKVSRAPGWIGKLGLEWIYRLLQEPGRLIGRYRKDIIFLITQSLRESRAIGEAGKAKNASGEESTGEVHAGEVESIRWQGALTGERSEFFPLPKLDRPFLIDLSAVTSVDSRGLGKMLGVVRHAWAKEIAGCFVAPSRAVQLVVDATKLSRILPMATTVAEARQLLDRDAAAAKLRPVVEKQAAKDSDVLLLNLPLRITAENAEECSRAVRQEWDNRPALREVVFDFGHTTFMDSSGLGFLLRCHRMIGQREGSRLRLVNLQENIRNVIRVSRLESILLPSEP